MKEALKELRKIMQIPDQKHWNAFHFRERALEEWIDKWITTISSEQLLLSNKSMPSEFEDMLKERLFINMLDQIMEESAVVTISKNKIEGNLTCLRRKPRA